MITGWVEEDLLFAQDPKCYDLSSPVWHNHLFPKLLPIPGYEDNYHGDAIVGTPPRVADAIVGTPSRVATAPTLPPAPPPPRGAAHRAPPPWMIQVMRNLKELPPNPNRRFQPTIFRVPPNIRRFDPQAYTPQVISIGPYHRKEPCLDRDITSSLQYYKRSCVSFLFFSQGRSDEEANTLLVKCLDRLKRRSSTVRSCYSVDDLELTDDELAELMLLDGCFIIRHLLKRHLRNPRIDGGGGGGGEEDNNFAAQGPLLGMLWIWKFVDYDLLKLENQIPFFILQDLFRLLGLPEKLHVNLVGLALQHFSHIQPIRSKSFQTQSKYLHLLHLFYSSLHPSMQEDISEKEIKLDGFVPNSSSLPIPHEWIPCAMELRRAGVAFKQNRRSDSFLDVTFKGGFLEIPSVRINEYTNSIFRNLIAFEQCYPRTSTRITTYAVFMDCLVDTAHDVSLLESSGIIVNRLSTDDEVAYLFNNLTNQVHCVLDKSYLRHIIVAVNRYHHQKWPRYRAGLMRDYFNNPWAIISVIAASIVIIFTGLQTFYTVYDYLFPKD